ncbi:uncharacterized protein YebE (UPF0316 family) [Motilibacter peucedani]|uniref:Uncharacterized protein YebE (UPF0316 family) n=1 Tax=Motilibacter peucedani TaxID=598650 RepID=A0A420XTS9_9ACTN|nr:DUF5698 domain-containing protein [Motilibacter peucedani]RKS80238.1 uncharacterized protein YebE (UPF0316 family) [Motilibacter peucedani]
MSATLRPLLVLALVLTEVGLWQWRVLLTGRGRTGLPVLLAILGAVLQVTAIAQVVTNVGETLTTAAYAAGVGGGVLLGVLVAARFAQEPVRVSVVTRDAALEGLLRERGWPVLAYAGSSGDAVVSVLQVLAPARRRTALLADLDALAPRTPRSVEVLDRASIAEEADEQALLPRVPLPRRPVAVSQA